MNVAVVGTGFAAGAHVDALRRLPGVEVAAIVGRTEERAKEFAAQVGVPRGVGTLDELLADPEVRAVHNCTPNDQHYDIDVAVLESGRHLLAEKPLARSVSECATLAALAADAPGVAGVCFNYRHFPLVQELRGRVASRPVHLLRGAYLQDWLLHDDDWSWRLDSARNGPSRAVADIGSHWLDLAEHVLGDRVVEVCASIGKLHESRVRPAEERGTFSRGNGSGERFDVDTEDFASLLVRFSRGTLGSVTVSQVTAGRKNGLRLEVDTPDAAYAWDQEEPNSLWIGHRDAPNEQLLRDPGLLAPRASPLARLPGGHQEGWADALRNLCADFYAAAAARDSGEPYEATFATFDDGAHVAELTDAVLESSARGGWTSVDARVGSVSATRPGAHR
jgi:predicted dehydrogenase